MLRLHDIIFFLWKGKYTIAWAGCKLCAILAIAGAVVAVLLEGVDGLIEEVRQLREPEENLPPRTASKPSPPKVPSNWSVRPKVSKVPKAKAE